jgi:uncharacterized membrane protein YfcA
MVFCHFGKGLLAMITLLLLVLLSQLLEVLIGFGGTFFAIILGGLIFGKAHMISIIVPINLMVNFWCLYKEYKHINLFIFFKLLLPYVALGLFVGTVVTNNLTSKYQYYILSAILIYSSSKALYFSLKKKEIFAIKRRMDNNFLFLFAGGLSFITIGAGGPFISFFVSNDQELKQSTRGTLAMLWIITNSIVIYKLYHSTEFITPMAEEIIAAIVALGISFIIGDRIRRKLKESDIGLLQNSVLLVFGLVLLFTNL